jgi:hypothetical protein|tara:strand:- start:5060 stop:5401 length:342 start_codon:yes stop_codon:yes gene_type:complete
MKKGPLSKKEKAYITANYLDTTPTVMAGDMDRSVHVVDKFVSTLSFEKNTEEKASTVEPSEKVGSTSSLFARNKKQGVTVMTEAASAKSDQARTFNRTPPKRQRGMIHTIKKD